MDMFNEYIRNRNVQIVIACILLLGIAIGGYRILNQRDSTPDEDSAFEPVGDSSEQTDSIQGDNGVIVRNQEPGNKVIVSQVVLQRPGWVAIADDVNGLPGRILGVQRFAAGKSSGAVDLLRNTEAGKSYIAVLRMDAGTEGTFEMDADTPVMSGEELIVSRFTVIISK